MGYSHYWYIKNNLDTKKFNDFTKDVKIILEHSENILGIAFGDGGGEGSPICENDLICFNGSNNQPIGIWTTSEDVRLSWPSDNAGLNPLVADPIKPKTAGTWFAGDLVCQRVAPIKENGFGSGSYETVCIQREDNARGSYLRLENDYYFNCCKTSYRPYDLTVTAVLIALKHHFPESYIHSDGNLKDWADGMYLCDKLFGYGLEFELDKDSPKEQKEEYKAVMVKNPVQPKKKITKATIKSYINKNFNDLYIRVKSSFDGMTDGIEQLNGGFTKAEVGGHYENSLGVNGAWFVNGSRDSFSVYEDQNFIGYEVWNCCGSFILATKKH